MSHVKLTGKGLVLRMRQTRSAAGLGEHRLVSRNRSMAAGVGVIVGVGVDVDVRVDV